ncbi:hypothetical protein [Streptomyces altiplanensis]
MRNNRKFFAAVIGAACLNVLLFTGTANAEDDLPWTLSVPTAVAAITVTVGAEDDLPWTGPTPAPAPAPAGRAGALDSDLPWTK